MKAKTELAISRYQDSKGKNGIHIELTDSISRVRFLSLDLTLEQFATAVTGMYVSDIESEYRALHLIGTTAENKTENIPVNGHPYGDDAGAAEMSRILRAIKKLEVGGWYHRSGDETNHHNFKTLNGNKFVQIVFFRHVKPDGTPVKR